MANIGRLNDSQGTLPFLNTVIQSFTIVYRHSSLLAAGRIRPVMCHSVDMVMAVVMMIVGWHPTSGLVYQSNQTISEQGCSKFVKICLNLSKLRCVLNSSKFV